MRSAESGGIVTSVPDYGDSWLMEMKKPWPNETGTSLNTGC
jgi:hypothetical protein